jgi:hypothetical protein
MKLTPFLFVFFSSIYCMGQQAYWQQSVDYQIQVTIDDKTGIATGEEKLIYINNSPDTLKEIYFHLYWNAFKQGSHYFEKNGSQKLKDSDFGEIKIETVSIENEPHQIAVFESIGQIKLKKNLLPGKSTEIQMKFKSVPPSCINRAGKNNNAGTDFTYTQWYPKICRYDHMGWHTDPYLGREFAGIFGKFSVQITCDKSFLVAGSGSIKDKKYTNKGWVSTTKSEDEKNMTKWEFYGENIHDFAFALDKDWIHEEIIYCSMAKSYSKLVKSILNLQKRVWCLSLSTIFFYSSWRRLHGISNVHNVRGESF